MTCAALAAIGLHLASWHSDPRFSGVNPGVYAQTDCGVVAGAYRNSERRLTVYAGWSFDPDDSPVWASAAIATGYGPPEGKARPVTPIAMVGLKRDLGARLRVRVGYVPRLGRFNQTHVVHLMIERRF